MKNKTKDRIGQSIIWGIVGMLFIGMLSTVVIISIENVTGEPTSRSINLIILFSCSIIGAALGAYWGGIVGVDSKYQKKAELNRLICDECSSDDVDIYAIVKWVTTPYDTQHIQVSRPFKAIPNGYCNNCKKEVEIVRVPYYTKEELES